MRRVSGYTPGISRRHLVLAAPALLAALRRLSAQQPGTTFATDVKVVNLFATVRDKKGQIVRDLCQQDFLLDEDGRPQTIRYFSQESNLPLTVGLLVDTSGSVRNVLAEERTASRRFLEQVLREDKDLAFVIHFDREVELLQDLTASRRKLEAALNELKVTGTGPRPGGGTYPRGGGGRYPTGGGPVPRQAGRAGGTTLFDAVLLASDELMRKQSGRKALIVLSDGEDNGSKVTLDRAVEAAHRADTLVYAIRFHDDSQPYGRPRGGYGGPRMGGPRRGGGYPGGGYPGGGPPPQANRPDGKKILERITRETGGACFEAGKKMTFEKIYARIEEELRHQYSIGYTPDGGGGAGFRKIRLTTRTKGLVVRTRAGYYPA